MRTLLFIITAVFIVAILMAEFVDKPEHMLTEREKIEQLLGDYTFNTPANVEVIFTETSIDKKTREEIKRLIVKSDEEYLPRSPRIPDEAENVLAALQTKLPEYDFGVDAGSGASYFNWLTSTTQWGVSSIETSAGHFSLWEKRTDVYQLTQ